MPDDIEARLAHDRMARHQVNKAAMEKILETARTVREREYAQASLDYSVKQIDRLAAWLARREEGN